MRDLEVLQVQPKDIHIALSIPLESLIKLKICLDNATVELPEEDENFRYLADDFMKDLDEIIKKVEGIK